LGEAKTNKQTNKTQDLSSKVRFEGMTCLPHSSSPSFSFFSFFSFFSSFSFESFPFLSHFLGRVIRNNWKTIINLGPGGTLGQGSAHSGTISGVSSVKILELPGLDLLGNTISKRAGKVVEQPLLLLGGQEAEEVPSLGIVVILAAGVVASGDDGCGAQVEEGEARVAVTKTQGGAGRGGMRHVDGGVVRARKWKDGHGAIALLVVDRAAGTVDREMLVVGAHTVELGVVVGKEAALEELVRGVAKTGDDVGGGEGGLLGFGVVVLDVAIELHDTNRVEGEVLVGPDLGGVKGTPASALLPLGTGGLGHDLDRDVPLGEVTPGDGGHEIAVGVVGILSGDALSLLSSEVLDALLGLEVPLDPDTLSGGIHQAEGMESKPVHVAVTIRNPTRRKDHCDSVRGLWSTGIEVPEHGWRLEVGLRVPLVGVDHVGKLYGVLDEEHWGVVPDKIPVALLGVEPHGEATSVALGVRAATLRGHGGQPGKYLGLLANLLKEPGLGELGDIMGHSEGSIGTRSLGVNDTFGDPGKKERSNE